MDKYFATPVLQVGDTKGTLRCCMARNPYNGYKYLCGATATALYLMQWYDPLNKFMLLKVRQHSRKLRVVCIAISIVISIVISI